MSHMLVTDDVILSLGWGGSNILAENESHIYANMCAKFGCGPTVVSKKKGGGTDRQTDRQRDTAALYSRYNCITGMGIHNCFILV